MPKQYAPLNISTLDGGYALEELQRAVRLIEADAIDRAQQEGPRKAILAVIVRNEIDKETGEMNPPIIEWEVLTRIPGTKSKIIHGKIREDRIVTPLFDGFRDDEALLTRDLQPSEAAAIRG